MLTLRPFQQTGAAFLAGRSRAAIWDTMGLGKTPQALAALAQLWTPVESSAKRILIVAPLATATGWQREAVRWLPAGSPELTVICREDPIPAGPCFVLIPWTDLDVRLAELVTGQWDLVIGDEAHRTKSGRKADMAAAFTGLWNRDEQTGEWIRTKGVSDVASRCWLLTGTPMPNGRHAELLAQLDVLKIVGGRGCAMRRKDYMDQYCSEPCEYSPSGRSYKASRDADGLRDLLARSGLILRREPGDVPGELPSLVRSVVPLAIKKLPVLPSEFEAAATAAVLSGKMPDFEEWSSYRLALGLAKVPAVTEWVSDYLEGTDPSGSLVVFCHHQVVGEKLAKKLGCEFASGIDDVSERQAKVDRFAAPTGPRVIVASMTACGTGMNGFQLRTSVCAFAELPVETATMAQAEGRVRRMKSDGTCATLAQAHILASGLGLEWLIADLLRTKADKTEAALGSGDTERSAFAILPVIAVPAVAAPAVAEEPADLPPAANYHWSWARDSRRGDWCARCDFAAERPAGMTTHPWSGQTVRVYTRNGDGKDATLSERRAGGPGWSLWSYAEVAVSQAAKDTRYLRTRALGRGIGEAQEVRPLTEEERKEAIIAQDKAGCLTAMDADHAAVINSQGWNKADGTLGRILSNVPVECWDSSTLALARAILPKYRGQVGAYPGRG